MSLELLESTGSHDFSIECFHCFNLCNKLILCSSNLDFPGTKYKVCCVICILYPGGDGGDGGNGIPGKSNMDRIPVNPANAPEVYSRGSQVDYVSDCVTDHCCTLCLEYWYHALDITTDACGGSGGNGGNGGDAGAAGSLSLIAWKTMNSNIEVINGKIDLNGFSSFWTFIRQQVNATLGGIQNELKPVAPACGGANRSPGGVQCTTCVCEYR